MADASSDDDESLTPPKKKFAEKKYMERLFSSLKLVKTLLRSSFKRETLIGLMHTNQGMKSMGIHTLDGMHLKLMQNVDSSATDSQAHEIVVKELAGTAKN